MRSEVDMVNHPPHYSGLRGPKIQIGDNPATTGRDTMDWLKKTVEYGRRVCIEVECIEVIRWIPDMRLATAIKYIWRVAFGGKYGNITKDHEDIEKAVWYLKDWLDNRIQFGSALPTVGYLDLESPTKSGI